MGKKRETILRLCSVPGKNVLTRMSEIVTSLALMDIQVHVRVFETELFLFTSEVPVSCCLTSHTISKASGSLIRSLFASTTVPGVKQERS